MPTLGTLAAFALASLVFVAIPGPNLVYIVGHGISRGRRHALAAAIGIEIGTLVHIAAAVAGLSAVIARSATAFTTVKYLGVAYLVYLGLRALGRPRQVDDEDAASPTGRSPVLQGIAVNVLNPKAALFFMAFLPQFMNPKTNPATQALVLGAVLFTIALTVDVLYALGAVAIGHRLAKTNRGQSRRRLLGATYLTLAVVAALTGHRPANA